MRLYVFLFDFKDHNITRRTVKHRFKFILKLDLLGNIYTGAHNGQTAILRAHHPPPVNDPEVGAILAQRAVTDSILIALLILWTDYLRHMLVVIGMNRIVDKAAGLLHKIIVGFIPHYLEHFLVDEIKRKTRLTIATDETIWR